MTCVLGLTGLMATGKSTVLKFFAEHAVPVYSADEAVHALYEGEAVAPVAELVPQSLLNGKIDRKALGAALVADPALLPRLEAIVHPLVRQKSFAFIDTHKAKGTPLIVLEVPLLFELDNPYPTDAVAVTSCADAVQKARALERPGMNGEKLQTILARQMPQAEKRARADFVIDTGTTLAATADQVEKIIAACQAGQTGTKGQTP